MNKKKIIFLFLLTLIFIQCQKRSMSNENSPSIETDSIECLVNIAISQPIITLTDTDMISQSEKKSIKEINVKLIESGKKAIPYLIERIDTGEYRTIFNKDLHKSTVDIDSIAWPVGVKAIYMIELILQNSSNDILYKNFSLSRKIECKHTSGPKLNLDDMTYLKELYRDWWEKNKDKSMVNLKESYSRAEILDNTCYQ